MKRPMFWAVVMFALGEVAYINTKTIVGAGIGLLMPFCGAVLALYLDKRTGRLKKIRCMVAFAVMLILGYTNTYMRDYERDFDKGLLGRDGEYISCEAIIRSVEETDYPYTVNLYMDIEDTGGIGIIAYGLDDVYNIGDKVHITGALRSIDENTNPGCFNFRNYYKSRGIAYSIRSADIRVVAEADKPYDIYKNYLRSIRKLCKSRLYVITDDKTAGVLSGILLGDRKAVDDMTMLDYRNSGIAHILAISGLHISLLFGLMFALLKKLGLNRYVAGGVAFFCVFSFAIMSGLSMSTLRALVMIVISMGAVYTGESYDMPIGLALAFLIILIRSPFMIYDGGVWMSVAAIMGVCVGNYIIRHIKYFDHKNTLKKKLLMSLIMSVSVSLVMLPVMVLTYHEFTPYSFLLNIVVIPLMTVVVLAGLLGIIVSFIYMPAAIWVVYVGKLVLDFYDIICRAVYRLPFNIINIGHVGIISVVIYYATLICGLLLLNRKLSRRLRLGLYKRTHRWMDKRGWIRLCLIGYMVVAVSSFSILTVMYVNNLTELIVFADVGQGDGILLRTDDRTNIVIDCGSTSSDDLGRYTISPMLKYYGMAHVDYWFISHTDKDHISGLMYILEQGVRSGITIDNIVMSYHMRDEEAGKQIIDMADALDINIYYMEAGDLLMGASYEISCAHPDENYVTDDINDYSLALSYISEDESVLFTGDMGNNSIDYMLTHERNYLYDEYDILKVPHHGSKNSADEMLYQDIKIREAVISCGQDNLYGHPHAETLELIDRYGIKLYRTDESGAVVFR